MTDANPRDLIRRLADALNDLSQHLEAESPAPAVQNAHKAWKEARAYLAQPEPEPDDPDYYLAWLLFACDGKLRPEAQRVLAAYGITQSEPQVPTDEEILALSHEYEVSSTMCDGHVIYPKQEGCDMRDDVLSFTRAVLARWGK